MLMTMLDAAEVDTSIEPIALISPHAGYVYSGKTAAHGYKLLEGQQYDRVVLIGPSHYATFPGASIYNGLAFSSPLGDVPLDTEFIRRLRTKYPMFHYFAEAEEREHSLEVQLPFLQATIHSFLLVPVLMYDFQMENCRKVAEALGDLLTGDPKRTLFVASTDLYHGPDHQIARKKTDASAASIAAMDAGAFCKGIGSGDYMACGAGPVAAAIMLAQRFGATRATLLDVTTSYEVNPGNDDYVVGYLSAALHR
jgi:MEMO1 family protein